MNSQSDFLLYDALQIKKKEKGRVLDIFTNCKFLEKIHAFS
jgi:hypothetical protein